MALIISQNSLYSELSKLFLNFLLHFRFHFQKCFDFLNVCFMENINNSDLTLFAVLKFHYIFPTAFLMTFIFFIFCLENNPLSKGIIFGTNKKLEKKIPAVINMFMYLLQFATFSVFTFQLKRYTQFKYEKHLNSSTLNSNQTLFVFK